jgi:hypothetical protein
MYDKPHHRSGDPFHLGYLSNKALFIEEGYLSNKALFILKGYLMNL